MAIDLSNLKPSLTGSAEFKVGVEHTAPSIGSGLVPVLATPVMINVIEAAALAAVEHLLPAGHQCLGIHLDFRHFADGYVAVATDVDAELERVGHELKPLDIVLVNTSAGARYGRPDYVASGCGMGAEATLHLLKRGVRVTGTDAWSWDAPFYFTAQKWAKDHDPSIIWEGHKAGRHIGYCHLEKLHNLEALPGDGFTIACFPHKIRGASAGWTRAVAIFEEP